MHNIKNIRDNIDEFAKKIKLRNVDIDIKELLKLDKQNRDLIFKIENFEKEKKDISKKKINLYFKSQKISPIKLMNYLMFKRKSKMIYLTLYLQYQIWL